MGCMESRDMEQVTQPLVTSWIMMFFISMKRKWIESTSFDIQNVRERRQCRASERSEPRCWCKYH